MSNDYDYVVIGGGLVGCLTSISLASNNAKVCLIEKSSFNMISADTYSPLSLTLNTKLFLKSQNLWDEDYMKSNNIKKLTIKVWNSFNKLQITNKDINNDFLGSIVDKISFLNYLRNACSKNKNITIIDNAEPKLKVSNKYHAVILDGKDFGSKKIFVTDGVNSESAKALKIRSKAIKYNQTSYIMNCSGSCYSNEAYQIFTEYGVFAILPVKSNEACIVATIKDKYKSEFNLDSDNPELSLLKKQLTPFVNDFKSFKVIFSHPLNTSRLDDWIKDNVVFLGNSSQLLHPFGAQGFNFAVYCLDQINKNLDCFINKSNSYKEIVDNINLQRESLFNAIDLSESILMNENILTKLPVKLFFKLSNQSSIIKEYFTKRILNLHG